MTVQDTRFSAQFADMTASVFYGSGQVDLKTYQPKESPINTGMLTDIGRVTVYGPEAYDNPYAKFMKSPLARGDSAMTARFSQVKSGAYDPLAPDTALFDGQTDENEMGVSYRAIDSYINGGEVSPTEKKIIDRFHRNSGHKRVGISVFKQIDE